MGRNKNEKGRRAEKTKEKEFKNSEESLQKKIKEPREEDIKIILARYENESKSINAITETKCDPPSPRCNMTLVAHPEKDQLIMFGGEFCNGRQTTLYNDLFYYNIKNNDWSLVTSPSPPSPRCSHQAVTFAHHGGEMWLFGGEYVSPLQNQYYHFNDLWVYSFLTKKWERISSQEGPSSRSGHRMVACRKMLFIFGGFRDNLLSYQYFNDLHAFSVDDRVWLKLSINGVPPSPRSGCVMAVTQDQMNVMVYGGYSKERVKKAVDKGTIHSDMFILAVDVKARADSKSTWLTWRWTAIKQTGCIPLPMCSTSLVVTSSNRAVLFGGVRDQDEEEDYVEGHCLNDMHYLEIDKGRWHSLKLKKPNIDAKKRRRKDKDIKDLSITGEDSAESTSQVDTDVCMDDGDDEGLSKKVKVPETSEAGAGGLFNFNMDSLNRTNKLEQESLFDNDKAVSTDTEPFIPSARMGPMMAAKKGHLYLYGGVREESGRQLILRDMYSIDIQHMDQWKIILAPSDTPMDWIESSSESDGSNEDDNVSSSSSENEDDEKEEDNKNDDVTSSGPRKKQGENFEEYLDRSMSVWLGKAHKVARQEHIQTDEAQVNRAAKKMAKEYWKKITF